MTLLPDPLGDFDRLRPTAGERGRASSTPDALRADVEAAWGALPDLALPAGAADAERQVLDLYVAGLAAPDTPRGLLDLIDTPLGPLPLATAAGATTYRLAVLCRRAGGRVPEFLAESALRGVLDVVGALCARSRVDAALVIETPASRWATRAESGDWRTMTLAPLRDPDADAALPTLRGTAEDLLAMTTEPSSAPAAFMSGRLRVSQPARMARLLGALGDVPGLPGAAALRTVGRLIRVRWR